MFLITKKEKNALNKTGIDYVMKIIVASWSSEKTEYF